MNILIIVWIILWFSVLGIPHYLFKKYKITYYENSWQHTVFYIASSLVLFILYKQSFITYFNNVSVYFYLFLGFLFVFWLAIPKLYKNDYFTKRERLRYQIPKFFDILFQQFGFLAGLLTLGVSPVLFGLIFWAGHIPLIFFLPKKIAYFIIVASLLGGLAFSYLQSRGVGGFLIAVSLHFLFYIVFQYALSRKHFLVTTAYKR